MNGWFITTCRALILAAFICFTIGIFGNSEVSTNGYITAYSVTIVVTLLLLTYYVSNLIRLTGNNGFVSNMYALFMNMGPFLFMLSILSLVLYEILKYKTNIIKKNVGDDYIWYSESIILVVLLQLMLIYATISDDTFEGANRMPPVASSFLYLLCAIAFTSYLPLRNILNYYTTDGFANLNLLILK